MVTFCVVPGCSSRENVSMFRCPIKNQKLMKKWTDNLKSVGCEVENFQYRRVCELHFDKESIKILNGGRKTLKQNSVPTIFTVDGEEINFTKQKIEMAEESTAQDQHQKFGNNCRICLKVLLENEETIPLSTRISNRFKELTNDDLTDSPKYPQQICLHCDTSMKSFSKFRCNLKNNQLKLSKALEFQETDSNIVVKIEKEEVEEDDHEVYLDGSYYDPLDETSDQMSPEIKLKKSESSENLNMLRDELTNQNEIYSNDSKNFEMLPEIPKKKSSRRKRVPVEMLAVERRKEKVACSYCSKMITRKNLESHVGSKHLKDCKFQCKCFTPILYNVFCNHFFNAIKILYFR
jgi:hypothetical protein